MDDVNLYIKLVFWLSLVIFIIILFIFAWKKVSRSEWDASRRLKIIETLVIDQKRKLILAKCDERYHLILIGGATDVVIESGMTEQKIGAIIESQKFKQSA